MIIHKTDKIIINWCYVNSLGYAAIVDIYNNVFHCHYLKTIYVKRLWNLRIAIIWFKSGQILINFIGHTTNIFKHKHLV